MRSVTVRLEDLRTMILNLGFVGENEHRMFRFDCKKMFGEYPSASVSLTVQPPAGDCYPAVVERDGDLVSWTVTDSDLIEDGSGELQLTFMVGDVKAKTCIARTKVERSLGAPGQIPTPIENWIEQAEEIISDAEDAATAAWDAADHPPIIDGNGYWNTWDSEEGAYVSTGVKAQGEDGDPGYSPTATVTKSGKVATISITDQNGTTTATVSDGEDGSSAIDDTSTAANKTWSAQKVSGEFSSLLTEITNRTSKVDPVEIALTTSGYIKTNGATINPTPVASSGFTHIMYPCGEGSKFVVYGSAPAGVVDLYAFVDANYNIIEKSVQTGQKYYYYLTAPTNAAYVIFQKYSESSSDNKFWCGTEVVKFPDDTSETLNGWINQGITVASGAFSVNSKRLSTKIPNNAITCACDAGYAYIVFGWRGSTYLGWFDGSKFSKNTMVPRNTEMNLSGISGLTLYVVLVNNATLASTTDITPADGVHFRVYARTDPSLELYNAPADAKATGDAIEDIKRNGDSFIGVTNYPITKAGRLKTNSTTIDTSDVYTDNIEYRHTVVPCSPGDVFKISGRAIGSASVLFALCDSSNNILQKPTDHDTVKNYTVIVPSNGAYIIVNDRTSFSPRNSIKKGDSVKERIDGIVDGSLGGYNAESYYVANDRQELVDTYAGVIALYDALVAANPNYITKNTLTSNTFDNYEYVFTTGNRNATYGERTHDASSSKPIVLIMSGVHGHERCSVMGLYLFAKALCEDPTMAGIRNSMTIKIIPIVCPSGYNNNSRTNSNGVNINRNFDADWVLTEQGMNYSGASAADQDETKVVQAWMTANSSAAIAIDWHNSAYEDEVTYFATCIATGFAVNAKKGYFHGIDRISGHWINNRKFDTDDSIFGYTGTDASGGTSYDYGKSINLNACLMETSWDMNGYGKDTKETIGVNAEAICAVIKGINEKLIDV